MKSKEIGGDCRIYESEIGVSECYIVIGKRFAHAGYQLSDNAEILKLRLIELFQYLVDFSENECAVDFSRLDEDGMIRMPVWSLKVSHAEAGDGDRSADYVEVDVPVDFLTQDINRGLSYVKFLTKYLDELSRCKVTFKDGSVLDGFIRSDYSLRPEKYGQSLNKLSRILLLVPVEVLRAVFDLRDGYCRFILENALAYKHTMAKRLYPIACSMKAGETMTFSHSDWEFLFDYTVNEISCSYISTIFYRIYPINKPNAALVKPEITSDGDSVTLSIPPERTEPVDLTFYPGHDFTVSSDFACARYSVSPFAEDCKVYLVRLFYFLNRASLLEGEWNSGALHDYGLDVRTEWGTAHAALAENPCEQEDGRSEIDIDVPLQYFVRERGDCREWYFRVMSALGELSVCRMKVGGGWIDRFVSLRQIETPSAEWDYNGTGIYIHLSVSMYILNIVFNTNGGWRIFKEDKIVELKSYAAKRLRQILLNGYSISAWSLIEMVGERTEDYPEHEFETCILAPAIHDINASIVGAWDYLRIGEGSGATFIFEKRNYKRRYSNGWHK